MSYWTWQLLKFAKIGWLAGPITHFFDKATLKTNPTHLLNFLKSSTKKNFMTKFAQIVAKYDPNLAKFGHTDLSGPWNSLSFIVEDEIYWRRMPSLALPRWGHSIFPFYLISECKLSVLRQIKTLIIPTKYWGFSYATFFRILPDLWLELQLQTATAPCRAPTSGGPGKQ